ncbi:MAG: JAB domain-containing protein, partial [Polynucleobacter sp.]|nr:JAB domain-containing protein [Polynucleobacter sp.]
MMRPRERLLSDGAQALSDAELLAIFLRSGSKTRNAIELSQDLLQSCGGMRALLFSNLEEFSKINGLG